MYGIGGILPWVGGFIFCKPELFVEFGVNVNALNVIGKGIFLDDILLPEYWFVQLMDAQSLQDRPHRNSSDDWHLLWEPLRARQHHCSLTAKGKAKEESVHWCEPVPSSSPGQEGARLAGALHSRVLALSWDKEGNRVLG